MIDYVTVSDDTSFNVTDDGQEYVNINETVYLKKGQAINLYKALDKALYEEAREELDDKYISALNKIDHFKDMIDNYKQKLEDMRHGKGIF